MERWEPVRQPGFKYPGLIELLGNPKALILNQFRNSLHSRECEAYHDAHEEESCGVINDDMPHRRIVRFFVCL